MDQPILYFLCTGNSARSQMAEGFGKKYLGDRYRVISAGIYAYGLNPLAVKVMAEKGIDISSQQSKTIDRDLLNRAALVITLCGDAYDTCPPTPSHVQRLHWEFPDPARAEGSEEERLAFFRTVRDGIEERIRAFGEKGVLTSDR
ncbi:MAG: Arsenate reductase [Candidatus Carbobacillus altaicus]|uniref:Arsenate reductase n=1 Tax=Candidatus Carbonibacillus altaicus TaxID=2163959 RepID=A0A2R6XXL9_9BACL|nr:MAG: Arsenate reductase [Candidatus Carbobacillus altaicus]